MREAAQVLTGRHDFTTFRAAECQANSPVRTLDRLEVERIGDEVRVHAAARSFLHHQVRSMVGTLAQAGSGRWTVADVRAALEARDRARCGPMAPPGGLYLVGVAYASAGQGVHRGADAGFEQDPEPHDGGGEAA
jgi:tRNA pseudouridine38-40 synthase